MTGRQTGWHTEDPRWIYDRYRAPQCTCMSPRRNWDSPNPSLASECALPPDQRVGGHSRRRLRGWGSSNSDDWRKSLALCGMYCSTYIFLSWELRGLSPNFHIHVSVSDLYIPRIGPHISSSRKGRPIVEIYNSLTHTWIWKLRLRPRYSFSGNICFKYSTFCLCSAGKFYGFLHMYLHYLLFLMPSLTNDPEPKFVNFSGA